MLLRALAGHKEGCLLSRKRWYFIFLTQCLRVCDRSTSPRKTHRPQGNRTSGSADAGCAWRFGLDPGVCTGEFFLLKNYVHQFVQSSRPSSWVSARNLYCMAALTSPGRRLGDIVGLSTARQLVPSFVLQLPQNLGLPRVRGWCSCLYFSILRHFRSLTFTGRHPLAPAYAEVASVQRLRLPYPCAPAPFNSLVQQCDFRNSEHILPE